MFQLVTDVRRQRLKIAVHRKRDYEFETPFLAGSVQYDSTTKNFGVSVEPNYTTLAEIAQEKEEIALNLEFDKARAHSIVIGQYGSLDVVDSAVRALDEWYRAVLHKSGAGKRFLVTQGNSYHLLQDEAASDILYGDAIIHARNVQAFAMMRDNKDLDYKTIVGKIMPIFLHSLGLKEYHLTHDLSEEGRGEAKFIIDKVGVFAFYKAQKKNDPAFFERYSYYNGDYHLSFSGQTKGDIVKKFVFEWLAAAAREQNVALRDDYESYLDELASDIHRTWIKAAEQPVPSKLIDHKIERLTPSNVVMLADFRHS